MGGSPSHSQAPAVPWGGPSGRSIAPTAAPRLVAGTTAAPPRWRLCRWARRRSRRSSRCSALQPVLLACRRPPALPQETRTWPALRVAAAAILVVRLLLHQPHRRELADGGKLLLLAALELLPQLGSDADQVPWPAVQPTELAPPLAMHPAAFVRGQGDAKAGTSADEPRPADSRRLGFLQPRRAESAVLHAGAI